jgi:hypothetical protein
MQRRVCSAVVGPARRTRDGYGGYVHGSTRFRDEAQLAHVSLRSIGPAGPRTSTTRERRACRVVYLLGSEKKRQISTLIAR